ncbi:MAG: SurA N-terminal domain-containing protein [Nitrospirae bacterium]|nr:SurA N-terminal domain-containing protein [Nitrospirota bacterium]
MLQSMRKHARFFYFLFFIVILSFVFWGVGTQDNPSTVNLAQIGSEKISVEEYWRAYERIREAYRETFKGQFSEEIEKKLKLKEMILANLIEEKVLLICAKESGITVTDKELQNTIVRDPRFLRDGVFRKDVYFKTLSLNRMTPEGFENSLRQQIMLFKMRSLIESVVDISPSELKSASSDAKKNEELKQAALANKKAVAVKSFVDAAKQKLNVKVKMELIS